MQNTDKGELAQRLSSLKLLKQSVAPRDFRAVPPSLNPQTETEQEITILGNYKNNNTISSYAYPDRGMIVWHLHRGTGSVHRFYQLRKGAAVAHPQGETYGLAQPFPAYGSVRFNGVITFSDDLWVVAGPTNDLTISPDLSLNFTKARAYAGYVSIQSATTSTTATSLTGLAHGGAWVDTRDGWQSQTTLQQAVTPSQLVTNSIVKKDGIEQVSLEDGIIAVLGGDLATEPTVVDDRKTEPFQNGFFQVYGDIVNVTGAVTPAGNTAFPYVIAKQWFSPYNIDHSFSAIGVNNPVGGHAASFAHTKLGAIDCYGSYSFQFNVTILPQWSNYPQPNGMAADFTLQVLVEDVYVTVDEAATPTITTDSAEYNIPIQFKDNPQSHIYNKRINIEHRKQNAHEGERSYLGTCVRYSWSMSSVSATTYTSTDVVKFTFDTDVFPNGVYENGNVGPVRLLQWTDVADGQSIQVRGMIRYGCTTGGALAPYVQPSTWSDPGVGEINWLPILSAIFNSDGSTFKRLYTKSEHERLVSVILPNLTLMSLKDSDQFHPVVKQMAQAAGFFDDLVSGLISTARYALPPLMGAAGTLAGGPALGIGLGAVSEGALSQLTGKAAGMYGGGGRYNVEGQSAGMYGSGGDHLGYAGGDMDEFGPPISRSSESVAEEYMARKRLAQAAGAYDGHRTLRRRNNY